jgi:hypothetical protein
MPAHVPNIGHNRESGEKFFFTSGVAGIVGAIGRKLACRPHLPAGSNQRIRATRSPPRLRLLADTAFRTPPRAVQSLFADGDHTAATPRASTARSVKRTDVRFGHPRHLGMVAVKPAAPTQYRLRRQQALRPQASASRSLPEGNDRCVEVRRSHALRFQNSEARQEEGHGERPSV